MTSADFAIAVGPELFDTRRPRDQIEFVGPYSLPFFDAVRSDVAESLSDLPRVAPVPCDLHEFERVHDSSYLFGIERLAEAKAPGPVGPSTGEAPGPPLSP